jgi:predicted nucleotidyltransferase
MVEEKLKKIAAEHPYPLIFATISGAHLYGFASPDSDYDLRGVHVLPAAQVVGLNPVEETIQVEEMRDGLELDLVTHDARKFFALMLKKNGYVLEQIFSPLIIYTTPEHDELKDIASQCVTRHHSHHYFGFAKNEWKLFEKENPRRIKPLLYIFRVLLTGINLMQTGQIEANLNILNEKFGLDYIPELIERKSTGKEKAALPDADLDFFKGEYERLATELEAAEARTHLPEKPTGKERLNDLLVRLRLGSV